METEAIYDQLFDIAISVILYLPESQIKSNELLKAILNHFDFAATVLEKPTYQQIAREIKREQERMAYDPFKTFIETLDFNW